jgi:signal transduction histidine kinase
VLDDSGIEAALEDLVGQFSNSGFQVTTDCDQAIGRLPDPVQLTIYRVVQESLNNAKNHSGTDAVRIELKKGDGELQLEIRDSGCGFDLKSSASRGFGLQGMMQRVRLLGGQCDIETKPGAGSRISIRLPLPQASTGSKSG